jgi:hypothetical protein
VTPYFAETTALHPALQSEGVLSHVLTFGFRERFPGSEKSKSASYITCVIYPITRPYEINSFRQTPKHGSSNRNTECAAYTPVYLCP